MELTRRMLIGSALAGAAAGASASQTPPSPPDAAPASPNWLNVSTEANQRNAAAMAKVALPQSTEPAFSFKA